MTPEQARFLADYFAVIFDREGPATLKVLRAVPNDQRNYRPDDKSRTAWELVKHVAVADLWFLDSICDGAFMYDPDGENKMTAGFATVEDVVEFYSREFPKRVARLRSTPGAQLAKGAHDKFTS